MAAKIVKADELKLTPEEASKLSAATLHVAEFYNVRMSEKAQAWCAFGTVAANIYYPRIFMIRQRKKEERQIHKSAMQSEAARRDRELQDALIHA